MFTISYQRSVVLLRTIPSYIIEIITRK